MARSESQEKTMAVAEVIARGGYARRLEDQYTVGMPDMIVALRNYPVVMLEAKILRGNSFGPSPRQWVEMKRMMTSGCVHIFPMCMAFSNEGYHFATILEEVTELKSPTCLHFNRSTTPFVPALEQAIDVARANRLGAKQYGQP